MQIPARTASALLLLIGLSSCRAGDTSAPAPSPSPSPTRRTILFPPTVVGATNSGPGSDPQSRIRFREQEERARREYDEQKRAEVLKKLEESRKTVEDVIAMRDLYQRDPAEYWRVMEDRNERGCSEGKVESCQYLAGLYRSQSRFADARRALVREREALEALKRDPEGYDEKYWGGTSLPKRAAIEILLADNAKRLEAFDRDRK